MIYGTELECRAQRDAMPIRVNGLDHSIDRLAGVVGFESRFPESSMFRSGYFRSIMGTFC